MMASFNRLALTVMLLALTLPLAYSLNDADISRGAQEISGIIGQSSAAYVAVLIALLISALMYMGSSIFSDPKLLASSKDTFYQGIMSLIIIASLPIVYVLVSQILIEFFRHGLDTEVTLGMFDLSRMLLVWNTIYFGTHLLMLLSLIHISEPTRPY